MERDNYAATTPTDENMRATPASIVCSNCGKVGHVYRMCSHPVTSYGIICYRMAETPGHANSVHPEYLMVQRKDSLGFVEFVRGKYDVSDKRYAGALLANMTVEERRMLSEATCLDDLWAHLWRDLSGRKSLASPAAGYRNLGFIKDLEEARTKFDAIRHELPTMLEQYPSKIVETEWGFPKGRRNMNERDVECASREFYEETGLSPRHLKFAKDELTVEEMFRGSNNVWYRHVYFVAKAMPKTMHGCAKDGTYNHVNGEIRAVAWFDFDDTASKIRDAYPQRKEVLARINTAIMESLKGASISYLPTWIGSMKKDEDDGYVQAYELYAAWEKAGMLGNLEELERLEHVLVGLKGEMALGAAAASSPKPPIRRQSTGNTVRIMDEEEFHAATRAACSDKASPFFRLTDAQHRVRAHFGPGSPSRSLLLCHGVGAGKTCTAITVAERMHQVVSPLATASDRRALVLVPAHLKDTFLRQLFDPSRADFVDGRLASDEVRQCVGNKYLTLVNDRFALDSASLMRKVHRVIQNKYYEIKSHMEFANLLERVEENVRRVEPDELRAACLFRKRVAKMFSNRAVIVDEVHNLRADSNDVGAKKVPPRLMQLASFASNVSLILMSATPMFNDAREIVFVANLLLANEKLPQIAEGDVFDHAGGLRQPDALMRALRGRVSFVRGMDPYAFPFRLTPTFHSDPLVVVDLAKVPRTDVKGSAIPEDVRRGLAGMGLLASPMVEHALLNYLRIEKTFVGDVHDLDADAEDHGEDDNESGRAYDMHRGLQASIAAFPGAKSTFAGCFRTFTRAGQKAFEYLPGVPKFLAPKLCPSYAPKIDTIVRRVMSSNGIGLVYSAYKLSGVVSTAMALEHNGFQRYDQPALLSGKGEMRHDQVGQEGGRLAYMIWTGDKTLCAPARHLDVLNSPENANGDIIKVILCTRKGSEGLDMKCIREVHVLDPWYNLSRMEQIVGRATRRCSHVALPFEERNTTIYMHAAVLPGKDGVRESIDMRVYRIAYEKQAAIDNVDKLLQQASIEAAEDRWTRSPARVRLRQRGSQGTHGDVDVEIEDAPSKKHDGGPMTCGEDVISYVADMIPAVFRAMPRPRPVTIRHLSDELSFDDRSLALAILKLSTSHTSRMQGAIERIGDRYIWRPAIRTSDIVSDRGHAIRVGRAPGSDVAAVVMARAHINSKVLRASLHIAIDMELDRVHGEELVSLASEIVSQDDGGVYQALRESMERGGFLVSKGPKARAHCLLFEPNADTYYYADEGSRFVHGMPYTELVDKHRAALDAEAGRFATAISRGGDATFGLMVMSPKIGMLFKLLNRVRFGNRNMLCSQSTAVDASDIVDIKYTDDARARTKRIACDMIEVQLRKDGRVMRAPVYRAFLRAGQGHGHGHTNKK